MHSWVNLTLGTNLSPCLSHVYNAALQRAAPQRSRKTWPVDLTVSPRTAFPHSGHKGWHPGGSQYRRKGRCWLPAAWVASLAEPTARAVYLGKPIQAQRRERSPVQQHPRRQHKLLTVLKAPSNLPCSSPYPANLCSSNPSAAQPCRDRLLAQLWPQAKLVLPLTSAKQWRLDSNLFYTVSIRLPSGVREEWEQPCHPRAQRSTSQPGCSSFQRTRYAIPARRPARPAAPSRS